ncbi:hypothetical protein K9N68_17565 [Kovacikia minuta CCNUW1]|uniref:hypothetical protein n=1 Tax=Kovacikia minuta TaxID=2931930 RepID=UPI001CCFE968|nr:hypothetical protein [Kovacikia minuta]UBF23591.1 hypothetical protein K9N68_17565 [Kovacikia minuta CCNUW1]
MLEISCAVPIPQTSQELDQAIRRYRASDLNEFDLFCQWQAIRVAALAQNISEVEGDRVPGEDSY